MDCGRRGGRAFASIVLLLGVAGCGAGELQDEPDEATLARQVQDLAEQAKRQGYMQQYEMLRDGVVTDAEYRQAYTDAVACYEQAGIEVQGPTQVTTIHGHDFKFLHSDIEETLDCESRYVMYANQAWNTLNQNVFTPEALSIARECFMREGVDADEVSTVHGMQNLDALVFDTCILETAEAVADPPGEVILTY